jgi:hypothetical protein
MEAPVGVESKNIIDPITTTTIENKIEERTIEEGVAYNFKTFETDKDIQRASPIPFAVLSATAPELLSVDEIAAKVFMGEYGEPGLERDAKLDAEGYDVGEVNLVVERMTLEEEARKADEARAQSKARVAQARKPEPVPEPAQAPEPQTPSPAPQENIVLAEVAEEPKAAETPKVAEASGSALKVIQAYPHKTFKSYMRWTILSKKSSQYKLASQATKDPKTAIMMKDGRYLVALGFAYASYIGQHIDIVMESGQVIPAIVGDWKAKAHTDQWNSASLNNGSVLEFLVSSNSDASRAVNGSGNYNTIFPGMVKEFRILN